MVGCLKERKKENGFFFIFLSFRSFFSPDKSPDIALRKARMQVASIVSNRNNLKTTFSNAYMIVKTINTVISVIINFFVILIALAIYGLDVLQVRERERERKKERRVDAF